MVRWLKSQKHVFWEAFFVAVVIFLLGLLLGINIEKSRIDLVENYYAQSEVSFLDMIALDKLSGIKNSDCNTLTEANIAFADRIYNEALILERYDSSNTITEDLKISHKKYDLLRAFVWMNSLEILDKCGKSFTPVVYLYEYETEDLEKKAKQTVWSNILKDLKEEQGNNIILIPIAVDSNLSSINGLVSRFNIDSFPVVIINNKPIYELKSVEELKNYL